MKNNAGVTVVCDSGVIIHLDELHLLGLLADFSRVLAPESVALEVAEHREINYPQCNIEILPDLPWDISIASVSKSFCLHSGETAVLARAKSISGEKIVLTDDTAARTAAQHMGFKGTRHSRHTPSCSKEKSKISRRNGSNP